MRRSLRLAISLSLLLLALFAFVLAGCKGGISDPGEYKQAAAALEGPVVAVMNATQTARGGSDPPEFGRNLKTLEAPLRALQGKVSELKVKDANLLLLHQDLAAAVDAHLATVETIGRTVTTTPLKSSKDTFQASEAQFAAAVEAWRQAVAAL